LTLETYLGLPRDTYNCARKDPAQVYHFQLWHPERHVAKINVEKEKQTAKEGQN